MLVTPGAAWCAFCEAPLSVGFRVETSLNTVDMRKHSATLNNLYGTLQDQGTNGGSVKQHTAEEHLQASES